MSDDSDSEVVYVPTGNRRTSKQVYHTREDCDHGPPAARRSERDRELMEAWGWRECHYCAGEHRQVHGTPKTGADRRKALRQRLADPDDDIHDQPGVDIDPEVFGADD